MKALIIRDPYLTWILEKKKTWEIRGSKTNIRGKIGLIKSTTGKIFGECELVDCIELNEEVFNKNKDKHQSTSNSFKDINYKKSYAWVLKNPIAYKSPKNYKHPAGAIIWVNV